MPDPHPIYRALVRLYPRRFREAYGDDLVQHFDDIVTDRGPAAAWGRTALDLAVTVPRYRLETVMNERHSARTVTAIAGVLAAAGVVSILVDIYPGALLLVLACALAISQRSAIARALRTPDRRRRRRRLRIAAALGAVFVASLVAYLMLIGDTWTARETVLAVIGNIAMIGAVGFLAAGLLTPKTT